MSLIKEFSAKCARALALVAIAICFVGCSNAQQRRSEAKVSQLERKVLIVYLSRTNNTKVVAEFIHEEIGGTLVPIELERPYPDDYRPMKSFLRKYNLKGKTVVPFNTNAGYGVGDSFATVKELCPDSNVLEGFTTTGGIERDGIYLAIKDERATEVLSQVRDWLRRIKVLS